ncbi:nicotinate (nicotinamide) nucleotide adenylyltransferase [bacterium endosymbiont of Bathymodiolus sp. 5 South]|jgi:nicotinate-nucleotide adenylyltransferase|uniref:nicotinate (nicotinamide) nucleotide adenylyltransferase n=1 Tax=bacterium endosymbiont of Bathymodiolus sp. 5 South TaxID=1181670 RepID=UPI0010B00DC0|nr:nicotinate (nicotinamide) nucleotide adenylyltransferase [bacterium endosymbiont of Bathymodiolus sp. 5 South]VVH59641.1 Nicotinate-nucleotide adenylyltransferase (EC [uncultured Gammaproteobacteria bacterium]SHN89783.1 Nicotinate-nucleotide adenylyltransferase [bacterium endosymbiont of Bathymodiolus sp. 5 South]SSC08887.1 Nicotinate-nucleotide adenylyltransferase [bacterium endosymbiont of Bathymodiolus sp. 5 South]VVH62181.1 Nicotinate-nucleotide adenylyltransferase (EC [uncultured Gammap
MIGFFGGSFDPIHYGHLKTARAIKKELALSQLFLMPCKAPVHKDALQFSNKQRLEMLNLALIEFNDLKIDTREIDRQTPSYTIDTLKHIKEDYPNKKIFLIIGQDSFNTLETWKDYQQFGDYAQPVILPRTADTQKIHTGIFFSKTPLVDISSTQIRNKIRNQQDLSGLLPENIIEYIHKL